MANPHEEFTISVMTREGIAESFNEYLEAIGNPTRFSPGDDRLTTDLCARLALAHGEVVGESADDEDDQVQELTARFLRELGVL
jgi:hypothetical protein